MDLFELGTLCVLAAVLVTLYLLQSRTLQRNFDTFREDASQTLQISVEMSRSELAAHRERAGAQSRDLTETVQHLAEVTAESARAMVSEVLRTADLQTTRLLSGSQDSARQQTELLHSLASHIAAKDTAGYERMQAATGTPLRSDPDAPPYPVPAEDAETLNLREQLTADSAAARLLRMQMNGGRTDDGSTVFGPYSEQPGGGES